MTRYDEQDLDDFVRGVRTRFVTRADLGFDFEAGRADVYDRAGLTFAPVPARPRPAGPPPRSAAVALAVRHLDDFCVLLESVWLSDREPDLPGSQIQRARDVLALLATRLRAGAMPSVSAAAALTSAADLLGLADVLLRAQCGVSPDDPLTTGARPQASPMPAVLDQLDRLAAEVSAALAGQQGPGCAARGRADRSAPITPRRRQAGGQ